jgi:hypothetical protein
VGLCGCDSCRFGHEGQEIIKTLDIEVKLLRQERDQLQGTLKQVLQECRTWKNRSNMMAMCAIKTARERKELEEELAATDSDVAAAAVAQRDLLARTMAERDEARGVARSYHDFLRGKELVALDPKDNEATAETFPWLRENESGG